MKKDFTSTVVGVPV
jgi:hypothetical protein